MKYILLMSGTKAGVEKYRAWQPSDMEAHMNALRAIARELTEAGEFVATQALTPPHEAWVVRGQQDGLPVTDGVFSVNLSPDAPMSNVFNGDPRWLLVEVRPGRGGASHR